MKKTFKKLLSILMVFCMVMGMLPVQAFARVVIEYPEVSLNKQEMTLTVGATEKLIPTMDPVSSEFGFEWTSEDSTIATVDSDGTVTAVGVGETVITATLTDNPEIMAASVYDGVPPEVTCVVTVVPAIISEVSATITLPKAGTHPVETGTAEDQFIFISPWNPLHLYSQQLH